jgi:hypothetical protein
MPKYEVGVRGAKNTGFMNTPYTAKIFLVKMSQYVYKLIYKTSSKK